MVLEWQWGPPAAVEIGEMAVARFVTVFMNVRTDGRSAEQSRGAIEAILKSIEHCMLWRSCRLASRKLFRNVILVLSKPSACMNHNII